MQRAVKQGKANTAMMSFANLLNEAEIDAVIYFVREAFMRQKLKNTRYHTVENGWENHAKYSDAFPFALGEVQLDQPWETLTDSQRRGKALFLSSCVSCHDRANVAEEGAVWESFPLSWPRNGVSPQNLHNPDAVSQASPYSVHDISPDFMPQTAQQQHGSRLFQTNCVFCHAADGSGKNWIGQFIEPHPKNFRQAPIDKLFTKETLFERISNGVEGTAMPAWRYVLNVEELNAVVEYMWQRFK